MKINYITLGGQRHPICFSLHAMELIGEEFGSMDQMIAAVQSSDLAQMARSTNRMLEILLESGRLYCQTMGVEVPPELTCAPGALLDISSEEVVQEVFGAITDDQAREVEIKPPKNAGATRSTKAPRGSTSTARKRG